MSRSVNKPQTDNSTLDTRVWIERHPSTLVCYVSRFADNHFIARLRVAAKGYWPCWLPGPQPPGDRQMTNQPRYHVESDTCSTGIDYIIVDTETDRVIRNLGSDYDLAAEIADD